MHPDATQTVTEKRVGLPALFFSFLKTGTFTFGGGYAMLSLMKR